MLKNFEEHLRKLEFSSDLTVVSDAGLGYVEINQGLDVVVSLGLFSNWVSQYSNRWIEQRESGASSVRERCSL